jgi:hypothetical protein
MLRKRILPVAACAVVHLVATLLVLASALGAAMKGFDGGPAASPLAITVLSAAGRVLSWPLQPLASPTWPSAAQLTILAANSVIWGTVALWGWSVLRRVRRRLTSQDAGRT